MEISISHIAISIVSTRDDTSYLLAEEVPSRSCDILRHCLKKPDSKNVDPDSSAYICGRDRGPNATLSNRGGNI